MVDGILSHFRDPQDPSKYQDVHDQIHLDGKWIFLTLGKEQYLLLTDKKNPKHSDGKWIFLTLGKEQYLLLTDKKNPKHSVKHKSHITKVMFLCTIVRPHFNPSVNSWWDSKLGIWPIGDWEPAKQKSKNRPTGTLVWKNKTVTKEVYRDLLISELISAIIKKGPHWDRMSRRLFIQQDGAKTIFMRMMRNSTMH